MSLDEKSQSPPPSPFPFLPARAPPRHETKPLCDSGRRGRLAADDLRPRGQRLQYHDEAARLGPLRERDVRARATIVIPRKFLRKRLRSLQTQGSRQMDYVRNLKRAKLFPVVDGQAGGRFMSSAGEFQVFC